jgi:hypothetical protein
MTIPRGSAFVKTAREAAAYAKGLAERAVRERTSAQAALQQIEAHQRSENIKLERAIRKGQPPPEPQPLELDRATVISRVAATDAIVTKLTREHAAAEQRLAEATSAVRKSALAVVALKLDGEVARLHELQETMLRYRADLTNVGQIWFSHSDGPIQMSPASAQVLTTTPDFDRCRFLASANAVTPWKALFEKLLIDPQADFASEAEAVPEAAE